MSIVNLFRNRAKPADRFERLLRPQVDSLYRFAFHLCGSREDAEELVQAFLTKIYPKLDLLETIEKPGPWLRRGLHNLYVDGYRRRTREAGLFCHDDSIDDSSDDTDTTLVEASRVETSARIRQAVQRLNPDQRIVVLLHHTEGYTLNELSGILQVPIGTLKSRLHRAHDELKKSLSTEPFTEPERVRGIERCKP